MPCERRHVEAMEAAFWELVYAPESQPKLDAVVDARDAAYAACYESPCVWKPYRDTGMMKPSCCVFKWMPEEHGAMTYCPHCGHKIAPLLAAPEGKP